MALIQLPPAPDGQTFVNTVTASGPVTLLVSTSSLNADICVATGRTWAEEARLYNIQNAPDGKQIAGPGDPLYQTAESMKARDSAMGGISASVLKEYNQFVTETPITVPNLNDTMNKIKDGSINADITSSLGNITSVASSLPSFLTGALTAAKDAAAEQLSSLQAQLPKLQALAATNVDVLTKQSIAATGKPPTEAQIKEASGALSIFQDAPAALRSQAEKIAKSIGSAATAFGGSAASLGASLTSFVSGIPEATVLNPDTGLPEPNPAYAAFIANPANASKLAGLSSLTSSLSGAATDLSSKFGSLVEGQGLAVDASTANVKAFGFAASLAKKVVGLAASATDAALNASAFDAGSITQTFGAASKLAAALDTSMYKNTKDADLTYTGDDGLVWDRVNTERLRRNLPGLSNARPAEPPPVDRGTTPPKDKKSPKPGITVDSAEKDPTPKPKKIAFDRDPNDEITTRFVLLYEKIKDNIDEYSSNAKEIAFDEKYIKAFFGSIDFISLRNEVRKIKENKPDPANYTDAERLKVKQREFYSNAYKQSYEFGEYAWSVGAFNYTAAQYNLLFDLWESKKKFKDVPLTVEDPILKDEYRLGQWEKTFGKDFFKTFEDWQKANPTLTPPTEA
jgi:hypothetical protein